MNEDESKQLARQILQPMFDKLTEKYAEMLKAVVNNMDGIPPEEQKSIIEQIFKSHGESLKRAADNFVPSNFEDKLKEYLNGRK